MPLYTVPKFLEVEMKIAGPFTFKQFLFILGGILGLIAAFLYLPRSLFFIILIVFIVVLIAFNAVKIEGTRLYEVFLEGLMFLFSPKVIVWGKERSSTAFISNEITFELAKPKEKVLFKKGGRLEKMKLYIQTQ